MSSTAGISDIVIISSTAINARCSTLLQASTFSDSTAQSRSNSNAVIQAVRGLIMDEVAIRGIVAIKEVDLSISYSDDVPGSRFWQDACAETRSGGHCQRLESLIQPLQPNADRASASATCRESAKRQRVDPASSSTSSSADCIAALTSSDEDEHAEQGYEWSVYPRRKNPLLALATDGVVAVLAELLPGLETLRLDGWPLCQRSVARLVQCSTLPRLRRLSLAHCRLCNLFTTLGPGLAPGGALRHTQLVELNVSACSSPAEPGDGADDGNFAVLVGALPALQRVTVLGSWTHLDDRFLAALAANCPDLRALVASPQAEGPTEDGFEFTDDGVAALVRACACLEVLSLGWTCGARTSAAVIQSTPALRVFVESARCPDGPCGAGSGDHAVPGGDFSKYNRMVELGLPEGAIRERMTSDGVSSAHQTAVFAASGAANAGAAQGLGMVSDSSLEYVDIRAGPLLRPNLFSPFAAAKLWGASALQHLSIGDGTHNGGASAICDCIAAGLARSPFPCLVVLRVPHRPAIVAAVLDRLRARELPALRSWTSTGPAMDSQAAPSAGPWTVEVLQGLAAATSSAPLVLEQLALSDVVLSRAFLSSLSAAFPRLRWLLMESYRVPALLDAATATSLLEPMVTAFPQLSRLYLPTQIPRGNQGGQQRMPDWFAFALLRAAEDTSTAGCRVVYPLPDPCRLPGRLVVESTDALGWRQYSCDLSDHWRAQCGPVGRATSDSVSLMLRGRDASQFLRPRGATAANKFVVAFMGGTPAPPLFLVGPHGDAWSGAGAALDLGEDSEDDSDLALPLPPKGLPTSPGPAFACLLRRLRRSSLRVIKLQLPRFLAGNVVGAEEDMSFRVNTETLGVCLAATTGSRALDELIVYMPQPQQVEQFGPAITHGLVAACPSWTALTHLHLREGLGADSIADVFGAMAEVYELRVRACSLQYVDASASDANERMLVSGARLTVAASESLRRFCTSGQHQQVQKSSGMFTEAGVEAVRDMLRRTRPHAEGAGEELYWSCGLIENTREVLASVVRGVRVQRRFMLATTPVRPQRPTNEAMMVLLDAFIDNGGALAFHDHVLSLHCSPSDCAVAAAVLRVARDLTPPYGVATEDRRWFVDALLEDCNSRAHVSLLPPPFFLRGPLDDAVRALSRKLEVIIPQKRAAARAANPTLGDVLASMGALAENEMALYPGVRLGQLEVASLSRLEASEESPPRLADEFRARLSAKDDLQQLMVAKRGACRQNWHLPGRVESWINESDLWYGPASAVLGCPLALAHSYLLPEVGAALRWSQFPSTPLASFSPVVGLAAGPLFACEFKPSVVPDSSAATLVLEHVHLIHDRDSAVLLEYHRARLAAEACPPDPSRPPAVVKAPELTAGCVDVLAGYHYCGDAGGASSNASLARLVVCFHDEERLLVTTLGGEVCMNLKPLCDNEAEQDFELPSAAVVIGGICLVTWGALRQSHVFAYNLWAAERAAGGARGAEAIDVLPLAWCGVRAPHRLLAWSGDSTVFVAGAAGGKKKPTVVQELHLHLDADKRAATLRCSDSIKLEAEAEATEIVQLLCSPRVVAVVTSASIQVFERKKCSSSAAGFAIEFRRCLPFFAHVGGGEGCDVKLIPGEIFFGRPADDEVLVFLASPDRLRRPKFGATRTNIVEGGQIMFRFALGNTEIMKIVGTVGGVSTSLCVCKGPPFGADDNAASTVMAIGAPKLLSLVSFSPCSSGMDMTHSVQAAAGAGHELQIVDRTPGAEAETIRSSVRSAVVRFSAPKGGRIAKLYVVLSEIGEDKRSEFVGFALFTASVCQNWRLAIEILDKVDAGSLVPPLWLLNCPPSTRSELIIESYLSDELMSLVPEGLRSAVGRFVATPLGATVATSAEAGLRLLGCRQFPWSADKSIFVLMLLASLGHGFGCMGRFMHLSCPGLLPGPDRLPTVEQLLTRLLDLCQESDLLKLGAGALGRLISWMELVHFTALGARLRDLLAKQAVSSASEVDEVDPTATEAWLKYESLARQVAQLEQTFTTSGATAAEVELADLEASIPAAGSVCYPPVAVPPVLLTPAMRRVASAAAAWRTGEVAAAETVDASLYRDYPVSLLCAACYSQRIERKGESDLEVYLQLRGKLIIRLLEAGAEVNRPGLFVPRYGLAEPCLPIDLLWSPTLIKLFMNTCARLSICIDFSRSKILSNLIGDNWIGCLLGAHGEQWDPYQPRYALLADLLGVGSFPLASLERTAQQLLTSIRRAEESRAHNIKVGAHNSHNDVMNGYTARYNAYAFALLQKQIDLVKQM